MTKTWKRDFQNIWGQPPPPKLTHRAANYFGLLGPKGKQLNGKLSSVKVSHLLTRLASTYEIEGLTELDEQKVRFWLGLGNKEDREMIVAKETSSDPLELLNRYKNSEKIETNIVTEVPKAPLITPVTTLATVASPSTSASNNSSKRGTGSMYDYDDNEWNQQGTAGAKSYSSYISKDEEKRKLRKLPFRPRFHQFPQWKFARTIIVGDLHGCADELVELLDLIKFKPGEDRLISVGDIVDRGPKISECFQIMREYKAWVALGNHEEPFLKWLYFETHPEFKEKFSGKDNPIDLTSRSDQADTLRQLTTEDWRDMCKMQLMFKLPELKYKPLVVHAGLFPGVKKQPEEQDPFAVIRMVRIEEKSNYYETLPFSSSMGTDWWDMYEKNPGNWHVVYGHSTNSKGPRAMKYSTGLDTGAVYGGTLTGLVIPPPGTDGQWHLVGVNAKSPHWVSSASELSGGQKDIIGVIK